MPCHPDRVRRNYEAGRAAAAAAWQRPSDIAAEQLRRRSESMTPERCQELADETGLRLIALDGSVYTPKQPRRDSRVTANVIEGEEHDAPQLPPIRIIREGATHATPFDPRGPDEPDEDCLWAV